MATKLKPITSKAGVRKHIKKAGVVAPAITSRKKKADPYVYAETAQALNRDQAPVSESTPTKKAKIKKAPAVAEKKAPAKKPVVKVTPFIIDLLLQKKFTDEEIHKKVLAKFGDTGYTTKKAYISLTRSDINHGLQGKRKVCDQGITLPINRLVKVDGELIEVPSVRGENA